MYVIQLSPYNSRPQTLVQSKSIVSASLHNPLPFKWRTYIWPFAVLYPIWLYVYFFKYETYLGSEEWTFVTLGFICTSHALSFLACQWSVSVNAAFTCIKVLYGVGHWLTRENEEWIGVARNRKPCRPKRSNLTGSFFFLKETDPAVASIIKIVPASHKGVGTLCEIHHSKPTTLLKSGETSFHFQKKKYTWDEDKKVFVKTRFPSDFHPPLSTYQNARGLETENDVAYVTEKYGLNRFEIPMPSFMELFKEHAVAPFFVFQIFCVGLWCLDEYWYYSLFTLFMLIVFECTVVFQRIKTIGEFRTMAQKPYPVYVRRNKKWITVQSDELLPGDLCSVVRSKDESSVPCDMVIVDGSCIVNEAMLSGESTPLLKESVSLRNPDDELDLTGADKLNVLYGGTKVLQVTPPSEGRLHELWIHIPNTAVHRADFIHTAVQITPAPDGGCLCQVVRTGFGTSQGKLVRTMVYSTERVTANNFEALLFILFLLCFAIAASRYVWIEGVKNDRKRSKLLLDCILIITSVVPPELPMELSLAVNTSLVALSRFAIYCTEPFRIPFAGKVDVCCFDKTGTLTGEDLVVEGVAGIAKDGLMQLRATTETPRETTWVLSSAHALVLLEDGIVGDPMEKVTLEAIQWKLNKGDIVSPKENEKGHRQNLQIRRRFQFSSALKRQASVSYLNHYDFSNAKTFVSVKGAPETLRKMYTHVPDNYEETYKFFTRRGSRVLALGYKFLKDGLSSDQINNLTRESVESDLIFAGFLVFTCPLKEDSKESLRQLNESSHRCIMITGDNALTACHVAREVEIVDRDVLILDVREDGTGEDDLVFKSIDEKIQIAVDPAKPVDTKILEEYDICLTGPAMNQFMDKSSWRDVLEHTWVYARVSPSQKEFILTSFKNYGYTTLMAGDGTNDVGALKQAHIGVALLDGTIEDLKKIAERQRIDRLKDMYENQKKVSARFNMPVPPPPPAIAHLYPDAAAQIEQARLAQQNMTPQQSKKFQAQQQMESMTSKLMEDMDMEEPPTIKFGDASVAAPFTSKLSNVVASEYPTFLTLNAAFTALICNLTFLPNHHSQSTTSSDRAAARSLPRSRCTRFLRLTASSRPTRSLFCTWTVSSLAICRRPSRACSWPCASCASRGPRLPLEKLSKERPQTNIFNPYIIVSVMGQFTVHIVALVYINSLAKVWEPPKSVDLEREFEPSLLNSAVYLIQLGMQVSTFAINYQVHYSFKYFSLFGYPFRERIQDNKTLYWGLLSVGAIALAGATEFFPGVNEQLKLVKFPEEFKQKLTWCMLLDFGLSYLIEIVAKWLFADNRPKAIARRRVVHS
ncbi:hypothetical protein BC936DRAFT_137174 [Jimgerdemannia flammicorona]|uniref:Uncharacterized protein n=1 Tax=Jimgerdemannia flammicorona TaxID=994334 RepID=A0A433DJB6_9FUNG|nr:hypothetical protein BC936DRAFT_137174 [Jimgerdemannia flammicorona]